ncbi:MAG: hypothetical protein Q7O66_19870 [Dehalococcoidia bacterium]|nr:hypothetical protein [Dehalococcoidia bacterium]
MTRQEKLDRLYAVRKASEWAAYLILDATMREPEAILKKAQEAARQVWLASTKEARDAHEAVRDEKEQTHAT